MDMPPIFVISPSEMEDRRKAVAEEMKRVGVKATMFAALYDGNMRLRSLYNAPKRIYQNLSGGSVCNAINHWCIWQHLSLSSMDSAIIFEDDVSLPDDFVAGFKAVGCLLPDEWDIFYLSLAYPQNVDRGKIIMEEVSGDLWRYVASTSWDGGLDGQYAYMVSRKGAKKMVEFPFRLTEPVDRWISFNLLPFLETYVWYPSPIRQKSDSEWKSSCGHMGMRELLATGE